MVRCGVLGRTERGLVTDAAIQDGARVVPKATDLGLPIDSTEEFDEICGKLLEDEFRKLLVIFKRQVKSLSFAHLILFSFAA